MQCTKRNEILNSEAKVSFRSCNIHVCTNVILRMMIMISLTSSLNNFQIMYKVQTIMYVSYKYGDYYMINYINMVVWLWVMKKEGKCNMRIAVLQTLAHSENNETHCYLLHNKSYTLQWLIPHLTPQFFFYSSIYYLCNM